MNSLFEDNYRIGLLGCLCLIALALLGCSSNYYVSGNALYERGNYIGAIDNYDEFILRARNGAQKTIVMNRRSEAYCQLGMEAAERNNHRLAIRLFYLANNLTADEKIAESYLVLAENAYDRGEYDQALQIYNLIIESYPTLPIIPEVVFSRLSLIHQHYDDKVRIWRNYILLVDYYSDRELIQKSVPIIDEYMTGYIYDILALKNEASYEELINRLLYFNNYPHSHKNVINREIGLLYFEKGEEARSEESFFDADKFYRLASEYNPALNTRVEERLNSMVEAMVNYGNSLVNERKIEEALALFERTFTIIPNNRLASEAIRRAEERRESIREAAELFAGALELENAERYEQALRLYQQSYAKDRLKQTDDKIFLMNNRIEIEKDPVAFARRIVIDYNNGIIPEGLGKAERDLREEFGDDVSVSGWRIMLSTGTNRYEVRYDITSRRTSYYFIWQVNLLNRQITPLNRESREVMEGQF